MSAPDLENEVLKAGLITKKSYSKDEQQLLVSVKNYIGTSNLIQTASATFTYEQLNAAGSAVAVDSGVAIPAGSLLLSSWMNVTEEFEGDGDNNSTWSIGIEAADDFQPATSPVDDIGLGYEAGITNTPLTVGGNLNMTWTGNEAIPATGTFPNTGASPIEVASIGPDHEASNGVQFTIDVNTDGVNTVLITEVAPGHIGISVQLDDPIDVATLAEILNTKAGVSPYAFTDGDGLLDAYSFSGGGVEPLAVGGVGDNSNVTLADGVNGNDGALVAGSITAYLVYLPLEF